MTLMFFSYYITAHIYTAFGTQHARHFEGVLVMLNLSFVMLPKQNELSGGRVLGDRMRPSGVGF